MPAKKRASRRSFVDSDDAPAWTDENASDPGITLLELFAFLTEQLIYRANRTPERHRRKFLSLVGFDPGEWDRTFPG